MQVISASELWVGPFTGLSMRAFRRLVGQVRRRGGTGIADGRPGRQWALCLEDRVLLVAVYWRTNLTMRQVWPLFGVSHAAVHRVIATLGPLLALAPLRRRRTNEVAIVNGRHYRRWRCWAARSRGRRPGRCSSSSSVGG